MEYPKILYRSSVDDTCCVLDAAEEAVKVGEGWKTAAEFFIYVDDPELSTDTSAVSATPVARVVDTKVKRSK